MDIVGWAVLFPIGILISGILSCFKPIWLGMIPTILYSIVFLSFHWSDSMDVRLISDIFLILAFVSVAIYGGCRLVIWISLRHGKDRKKKAIDKSKVQDL